MFYIFLPFLHDIHSVDIDVMVSLQPHPSFETSFGFFFLVLSHCDLLSTQFIHNLFTGNLDLTISNLFSKIGLRG